ncbi:hypothetical protein [Streptomyces sp. ISL-99]|uniref:hypothetical protein n=1 Tax=Streptomyces sp. ISL-99 TaxID=2819193 RepID=UPI00203624C2|nr:hypothetical protein [Streptomyces sp. ISL-99]
MDWLRTATGHAAAIPLLRPLAVDLEMLAMLLEGDPTGSGGRLDLSTGECRPAFTEKLDAGSEAEEAEGPERWLCVPALGSRAGYRDMELFIEGLGRRRPRRPAADRHQWAGRLPAVQGRPRP